jgi:holliday junction DNA helicase RuvA
MIGSLKGKIQTIQKSFLILDVRDVGYQIFIPHFELTGLKLNDKKEYFIYTYVKEDQITLYGFSSLEDQEIFINLISIAGIGPKTAINILSYSNGSKNIVRAVQEADVDFFSEIKGIAKKTAQRIIVDLKPKIGSIKDIEFETEADRDLVDALYGLGFSKDEVKKAIKGIDKNLSLQEKLKQALKEK